MQFITKMQYLLSYFLHMFEINLKPEKRHFHGLNSSIDWKPVEFFLPAGVQFGTLSNSWTMLISSSSKDRRSWEIINRPKQLWYAFGQWIMWGSFGPFMRYMPRSFHAYFSGFMLFCAYISCVIWSLLSKLTDASVCQWVIPKQFVGRCSSRWLKGMKNNFDLFDNFELSAASQ